MKEQETKSSKRGSDSEKENISMDAMLSELNEAYPQLIDVINDKLESCAIEQVPDPKENEDSHEKMLCVPEGAKPLDKQANIASNLEHEENISNNDQDEDSIETIKMLTPLEVQKKLARIITKVCNNNTKCCKNIMTNNTNNDDQERFRAKDPIYHQETRKSPVTNSSDKSTQTDFHKPTKLHTIQRILKSVRLMLNHESLLKHK